LRSSVLVPWGTPKSNISSNNSYTRTKLRRSCERGWLLWKCRIPKQTWPLRD
jgi:hypothetical protein